MKNCVWYSNNVCFVPNLSIVLWINSNWLLIYIAISVIIARPRSKKDSFKLDKVSSQRNAMAKIQKKKLFVMPDSKSQFLFLFTRLGINTFEFFNNLNSE